MLHQIRTVGPVPLSSEGKAARRKNVFCVRTAAKEYLLQARPKSQPDLVALQVSLT